MLKLAGELIEGQLADHMAELDPHLVETLPVLLKGGNLLHISTNAGWTVVKVGSGTATQQTTFLDIRTGITANSSGLLRTFLFGFGIGSSIWKIDWDKKLYIVFNYMRGEGGDTEALARFQVKEVDPEGALAAKGLGLRVDNLALKGESYGTSLGVVDLGVTIASWASYQIVIIHYPGSKIEWYVDGVLKGTQSTSANIPSGLSADYGRVVFSLINGATGGVPNRSYLAHPKIWQER